MKFTSLLVLVILFAFNSPLSAQAKKNDMAKQKVEELNKKLSAVNTSLALTENQKTQALAIYEISMKTIKEVNKSAETEEIKKEKVKALRLEMNKNVKAYVLTKEQRKALIIKE